MTRIDPDKHPNLAPLQALCDQQRAIAVMKRYGCYVVPRFNVRKETVWTLRDRNGQYYPGDLGLVFSSPEAALVAAGEYLDSQHKASE